MAGARMVRRIRMMTSMRQPRRTASLRAGPGGHARHGYPCRSSPVFG
jgi:hypothetical protein